MNPLDNPTPESIHGLDLITVTRFLLASKLCQGSHRKGNQSECSGLEGLGKESMYGDVQRCIAIVLTL
jgi:hypothetical protein